MSPSDGAVAWIAFVATLIQTGASVLQVTQGGGQQFDGVPRVTVQVKRGFVALLLELIAWLVSKLIGLDPDTFWIYVVYTPVIFYAVYAGIACIVALGQDEEVTVEFYDGRDPIDIRLYDTWADVLALVAGTLVCIAVVVTCLDLVGMIDVSRSLHM